ncbi:DUF3592 domain-containing protein [Kitasatospora sp. NPDC048545]|uniref:DUF3592 domain-containing protein n=1 Tax=Kitasatospora sp. NPDC048545 TaxID=3157208 RepID=UPI0033E49EB2
MPLYNRTALVIGLVVFGGFILLSLAAMGAQARYHYRYADAGRVQATVVTAEYRGPKGERPGRIVLALADGREVTPDRDLSSVPAGLETGSARTVLVNPNRPSTVAFPAQVGWGSVLLPWVLMLPVGVLGTAGMLLYRAFWGRSPVAATKPRQDPDPEGRGPFPRALVHERKPLDACRARTEPNEPVLRRR